MNKQMILLTGLLVTAMVAVASVDKVMAELEIRGAMSEINMSAAAYGGTTWDAHNFTEFCFDEEKCRSLESLTVAPFTSVANTIATNGLTYVTTMWGAEYKNPSLNITDSDYRGMGWLAKKYMAVNAKPDTLSRIVFEMSSSDRKILRTGESWVLGNGYTLTPQQIDLEGSQVWLLLKKDDVELESSIIDIGTTPSGDTFKDIHDNDIGTTDTFVYQPDIGGENDVPVFSVAVTAIFRGMTSNIVQLKYAILIDDELLDIDIDYESHKMKVIDIGTKWITMKNSDETITLTEDSDINIMGDIVFHVAKDGDGDSTREYRFYPAITNPDSDTYHIRGTMSEINMSAATYGGTTWNAQSFTGFWYDGKKNQPSETLTVAPFTSVTNTLAENGLTYVASMRGTDYKNPSLNITDNDYWWMGWLAKKHMAVNAKPDILSRIVFEMSSTDSMILKTGESWVLGNGYTLTPMEIDITGNQVWFSLKKDGVELINSIIDIGTTPSGDTFKNIHGNDIATTDTFVYQPDIGSENDVPVFSVAVTAIFRGMSSNIVQLKYALLIDDELLNIDTDYESHKMKVVDIGTKWITMKNSDETIILTEDSDINIMGDIVFHVATDGDGDSTREYRFYPAIGFSDGIYSSLNDGFQDKLFYPHIAHIASKNSWETEVCIINTSSSKTLTGNLIAYNNNGLQLSSTAISLAANARIENTVGSSFRTPANIGYMIFDSDSPNMCGYMKFFIGTQYRGAIPAVSQVNTGNVYISHIASDTTWWTGISLLNTTNASKTITIEFSNGTTQAKIIAANEHQVFSIKSLFSNISQPDIKSAVIKNANGIVGLEVYANDADSGANYLSGILLKDDTTNNLYFPHIGNHLNWWTGIVAYNPSSVTATMTITPYKQDGTVLTTQTVDLEAGIKYIKTASNLNFPEGAAWFHISSTRALTGIELFATNDGKQLCGYACVNINRTSGVFPKIETSGWTSIALVNIENSTTTVTLTAYDDDGNVIDTAAVDLNAYEKLVKIAPILFSGDISTATYISFSSGNEIVGFQLNGSTDSMMLDALPGM